MGCVYSRACIGEICTPKSPQIKPQAAAAAASEVPVFSPPSTPSSGSEGRDHLHGIHSDPNAAITRLSRVSAQFLPPEGSRTVRLPSSCYELRYSYLSQRGYYPDALDKANQDSFCIHAPFGSSPEDHLFGVFDGHGEFGAQCSQFARRRLCENLLKSPSFCVDPVEALHAAYLATNAQLHADGPLDDSMSGTTAVTALVRGRTVYVANAGDSRAVVAEREEGGGGVVAVDLSIDQTPFREDELERVRMCGARVLTLDQIEGLKDPDVKCWGNEEGEDDGDPPRLWVPNGMYPGTAFTRSIGDSIAESIGVIANPEIAVLELTERHPFLVLASDGVFEFLSSQNVVDMVAKYKDPRDACAAIVAESYRLWLQYETRTDDITVIVVHIDGLTCSATGQSAGQGNLLRPNVPQVVEVTGSESPSTLSWSHRNHRVRHDLSKARLRTIESSLEKGKVWVPPSSAHRKTWEEEAHIERALHDHFLFRKLTDTQCHVLLDCMQRVEVQPGEVVVQQGGEGDCFYVVGSGEFEVLATQEEKNGEVPRVLQRYTAEKLSSFGELALMYNKPLQASVRAVTSGTLWALKREDFRGILISEFTNLSSMKLLRSVDLLARLTILQLSQIADSLTEVSFSDGQTIVDENDELSALYIIQKGKVRITFDTELLSSQNVGSLKSDYQKEDDAVQSGKKCSLEKIEGSYFGEWALLGEQVGPLRAMAVGDCICSILSKEKFDSVVGPLAKLSQDVEKTKESPSPLHMESRKKTNLSAPSKISFSDLEWRTCLYSTDCSEIGHVVVKDSGNLLSLKRFNKQKIKSLGKEAQVMKEKNLFKSLNPSVTTPEVLCTCADRTHVGILFNVRLACPLAPIIHSPLNETSAKYCAASVVTALEDLHKNGILYRGVSPDVLMLDQAGHVKLVDFRFGKKLSGERTFTICGMADSLAPEIVQGNGHGFPADWWALGVLVYFMLHGEMPFGSWRESELDTYAKIAKGLLALPPTFSAEAADLVSKLLEVDDNARLGSLGPESVKSHPWFNDIDWNRIRDGSFPIPSEIKLRIAQYLGGHPQESVVPLVSPTQEWEDLNVPEWLDDW